MRDLQDVAYYLPYDTEQLLIERIEQCSNLGLILDKYPHRMVFPETEEEKTKRRERVDDREWGRGPWLNNLLKSRDSKEAHNQHIDAKLAKYSYDRWDALTKAMDAQRFSATTNWRMIVGLGGETVLETDLTLHHLYSIPFIPGSALKGLTRAYVIGEVHQSSKIENDPPIVQQIFGTQKDAGSVIFFDAMPADGKVEIDLDIMNAHYPKYYGGQQLPTNDQDPNPVTFLTVKNTTFRFAIAPRRRQDVNDVKLAMEWLQKALQEYGVGGKTSAGYGYFTISMPTPYIRPNIPKFVAGQRISGTVVAPTDELRSKTPEAKAFLRYREFSTKYVLIIVEAEEAVNWTAGQTRNCLFVREEEREGCTVLIC